MIAKYLKDFSTPAPAEAAGGDILESLAGSSFGDLDFGAPQAPEIDIEEERQASYGMGFRAATQEAEIKHEEELTEIAQAHAADIEQMAAVHEDEVIGMIHRRFQEMTQALSQSLAEQTLQVLLPVFDEELCRRSIATLAASVHDALQETGISAVVVRGPANLYERLKPLFDDDGVESRFVETSLVDISVEINETVLVTRLAAWAQSLSEVTG
jgi:hypothetical protein